uniref:Uncharacterized protein n=1 Tax=Klebsiella pneumoniae TaxID=573 RepID=W8E6R6_KLEPN|nr:hypothetical protein [Klebsiella pneumoniae]
MWLTSGDCDRNAHPLTIPGQGVKILTGV